MGYLSCNAESAIATCDPYNWDRKKSRKNPIKLRHFTYSELVAATKDFSSQNFLGRGSHGKVYKAVLDGGRLTAAVKRHSMRTGTNTNLSPAENEIEILSRIQHPCLVNLVGYNVDSNGNKLLVVEYMPNGSLHDLLHSSGKPPGWTRRVRFVYQVAKAVHALHSSNPPVIHRDIKASNVLIDEHGNARLGDFGLALRGHIEDVRVKCTPPAGTLGYLDPAYVEPSDLSTKSDVFSFGILLLEIISGRNAIDVNYSPPSIVDWVVPLLKRSKFTSICDTRVRLPGDLSLIQSLAILAGRCVRSTVEKRPDMAEVVEILKSLVKRVHVSPLWKQLKRHIGHKKKECGSEVTIDERKMVKVIVKVGSRKNRKVSNVSSTEYESKTIIRSSRSSIVRSKSVNSITEILQLRSNFKKRNDMVKAPVLKLTKSKSTGVIRCPPLVHYINNNYTRFLQGIDHRKHQSNSVPRLILDVDDKLVKDTKQKLITSL